MARALAMELSESDRRMSLLADLRDSPFPQNRIHFSAYLRGEAGQQIASNMASRMELSGPEMQRHLTAIPELELIVPRMYDRAFWDGDESVIVVGLHDLDAGYSAPLRGFDVLGNEHVIEMWRGIMDRPILMVYPVQYDFGANPEARRAAAPTQPRKTISRPQDELHPDFFGMGRVTDSGGWSGNDTDSSSMTAFNCGPSDGEPEEPGDECEDEGGGGFNWGGYFMPSWLTWNQCIFLPYDLDGDGFDDECIYELAKRFAPVLATHPDDIVTREPAWTAGPIPGDGRVVIFYAISYHFDLGCRTLICSPVRGATRHFGDSEWIVLLLEPVSPTSNRWRVVRATLSAHWQTGFWDYSVVVERSDMFWADEYAGRPLIWVSEGKHANYKSRASCNGKPWDTCSGNVREPFPLEVLRHRHLGLSWGNVLMDCVSSHGHGPQPGQECYWTANRFRGWQDLTPDAGGYKESLAFFGF